MFIVFNLQTLISLQLQKSKRGIHIKHTIPSSDTPDVYSSVLLFVFGVKG